MGAPISDEDEVDADDCDVHATSLPCAWCFLVHAHWFGVIPSKLRNVPFTTPGDNDLGSRSIIHHGINFDFDSVSVVLLGNNNIQSRTKCGVVSNRSIR